MNIFIILFVASINLLSFDMLFAKTWTCDLKEKPPFVKEGCEGELCGFSIYQKAIREADIHIKPGITEKKIGKLKKCSIIREFDPYTLVFSFGKAKFKYSGKILGKYNVKAGDIIAITKNLGEGYIQGCIGKELLELTDEQDDPEATTTPSSWKDPKAVSFIADLTSEEWIKIKTEDGMSGYVKTEREWPGAFYMGYYDYSMNSVCPEDLPFGATPKKEKQLYEAALSEHFEQFCTKIAKIKVASSTNAVSPSMVSDLLTSIKRIKAKNVVCEKTSEGEEKTIKNVCDKHWEGNLNCQLTLNPETKFDYWMEFHCNQNPHMKPSCTVKIPDLAK